MEKISQKKILFFSTFTSSFIESDFMVIKKLARVKRVTSCGISAIAALGWNLLFNDVLFCWFGTVYSAIGVLWARTLRKRSVIVLGGVDVARMPEINYGIWVSRWKSKFLTYGFRHADVLLAVSPDFKDKAASLAKYDGHNVIYLPTAFDGDYWALGANKEKFVLTVALLAENLTAEEIKKRILVKGIDLLLQTAARMPEIRFILVGMETEKLRESGYSIPANLAVIAVMEQDELKNYYQKATVYFQPSRSEGLPNTLCEAMACGCIPVGSTAGGIPEAIGDTGYIVAGQETEHLCRAISMALQSDPAKGIAARNRVVREFTPRRRYAGLAEAIIQQQDNTLKTE